MSWSDLTTYLQTKDDPRIVLKYADVERIIGQPLPQSAGIHRPFWANARTGSYAQHWMTAGYATTSVGVPAGSIAFERTHSPNHVAVTPQLVVNPGPGSPLVSSTSPVRETVILVGCVKTKVDHPAAAKDLYSSDQFLKRRSYAEASHIPWFILSARHGLAAPDDLLEPYDVALADQTPAYRAAWGEWVAARLELELGELSGRHFAVLAGATYADAIAGPLSRRGAVLDRPLEGLRQGEQLAWFNTQARERAEHVPEADPITANVDTPAAVAEFLGADANAIPAARFLAAGRAAFAAPGMYSWWVDADGASELTGQLGHTIEPGLIYAGQAGATRRLSGKPSTNTLWGRLAGMHLGGRVNLSTFRLTLAAILQPPVAGALDEAAVTEWMKSHLSIAALPMSGGDAIDEIETAVLAILNPPLNIAKRPSTPLRAALSKRRKEVGSRPHQP